MVLQEGGTCDGKSPQEVYAAHCEALGCKKNSYLLKALPALPNSFSSLVTLDLSLNFVGRVGLRAVLAVVSQAHSLERLGLADNWLDNQLVRELASAVAELPKLHYLDLSRNPISHTGGRILSDLVHRCPGIYAIQLEGTLINPALVRIVQRRAEANRVQAGAAEVEYFVAVPRADAHGTAASLAAPYQLPAPLAQPPPSSQPPPKFNSPVGASTTKRQFPALLSKASADLAQCPPKPVAASPAEVPEPFETTPPLPLDDCNEEAELSAAPVAEEPASPPAASTPLAPLNTVFEVVEDDARAADFVGLAVLHAVAREAAPAAITACLPCPPAGRCPEAEAAVPLEAGTPASRCASPDNWYAMRLVWLLVQKEKQSGNENWGGLASVVSLIQKKGQ
eukprot:EG_transcript_14048